MTPPPNPTSTVYHMDQNIAADELMDDMKANDPLYKQMVVEGEFLNGWEYLQAMAHLTALEKGWWDDRQAIIEISEYAEKTGYPGLEKSATTQIKLACIALMHSELSEALESVRHGEPPDDKIPEFSGVAAELADVIIRIMDYAERFKVPVAKAVIAKMAMNKGREFRHGGKLA